MSNRSMAKGCRASSVSRRISISRSEAIRSHREDQLLSDGLESLSLERPKDRDMASSTARGGHVRLESNCLGQMGVCP